MANETIRDMMTCQAPVWTVYDSLEFKLAVLMALFVGCEGCEGMPEFSQNGTVKRF